MLDISTLNKAQYDAVTAQEKALLIIAGAGSGKTRTLVYRLAWLIEQGLPVYNILLLTFTRKAASQMLDRASLLLGQNIQTMRSGTFHSFAFSVLRQYPEFCLRHAQNKQGQICIIDSSDQNSAISHCKDVKKIAKGDKSFPKAQAIISLISKARNKELSIEEVLQRESQHLLQYVDEIQTLSNSYTEYKRTHGLFDYDDLLFEFENLLTEHPPVLELYHNSLKHIMVDEYQDTNKVQARLIRLLKGENTSVMAVGDDAQSIYAFRGATIKNILDFPKLFSDTRVIYLEENYRSLQPVLNIANDVLSQAKEGYSKHLYSTRGDTSTGILPVRIYRTLSDISQAKIACQRIQEYLLSSKPAEIAVLFRSGYQAYHLEAELNKHGIPYRKFGGIKYTEAAHVKDLLAYARLILNPQDAPSFERIAGFSKGVGAKTAQKMYALSQSGDSTAFEKYIEKYPEFKKDIYLINDLKVRFYTDHEQKIDLTELLDALLERYKEHLPQLHPDDYPRRVQALEELLSIAIEYKDLDLFISDLILDISEEEEEEIEKVVLSTVHSAKGLEWDNVLIMDLVEDRFPSRHALTREEDFEEERRLLYVACTRARNNLDLFVPLSLYQRGSAFFESATPSPFIRSLNSERYKEYHEVIGGTIYQQNSSSAYINPLEERQKNLQAQFSRNRSTDTRNQNSNIYPSSSSYSPSSNSGTSAVQSENKYKKYGFCKHKIFGRGKIIDEIDNEKYKINFPNIGVKTIIKSFVELEDE